MALVTTIAFDKAIEVGDPVSQAKIYQAQAADELIFLDLDAYNHNKGIVVDVIRSAAEQIFIPFTVGGGVKSIDDFRLLLSNGADKVSLNTAAVENPELVSEASRIYGAQCVVVSIDYRRNQDGTQSVWVRGGKECTKLDPIEWAKECERLGAGEVLLTCIDNDGSRKGLDLETIAKVSRAVSIPVIASGGCGLASHFIDGFKVGNADAVSAGTFFCFQDQNPMQTRAHIKNAGIPIRIHT
jgi:cyclase